MGRRCDRPAAHQRLQGRAAWSLAGRGVCAVEDAGDALWMLTEAGEQRLAGASLLIFANKTDVDGCMDEQEIRTVRHQKRTRRSR